MLGNLSWTYWQELNLLTKLYLFLLLFKAFWIYTVFEDNLEICYKIPPPIRVWEKSPKGGYFIGFSTDGIWNFLVDWLLEYDFCNMEYGDLWNVTFWIWFLKSSGESITLNLQVVFCVVHYSMTIVTTLLSPTRAPILSKNLNFLFKSA